jgi:hypothetical protein
MLALRHSLFTCGAHTANCHLVPFVGRLASGRLERMLFLERMLCDNKVYLSQQQIRAVSLIHQKHPASTCCHACCGCSGTISWAAMPLLDLWREGAQLYCPPPVSPGRAFSIGLRLTRCAVIYTDTDIHGGSAAAAASVSQAVGRRCLTAHWPV